MADKTITATIKVREGSTSEWTSKNPVLASGEFGYDWLAKVLKIGDGVTEWSGLNPINGGSGSSVTVVQTTGSSTTSVMSQNAVTTNLNDKQAKFISGTSFNTSKPVFATPKASQLRSILLNGTWYMVNQPYKSLSTPKLITTAGTTVGTINLSTIIPSDEYLSTGQYELFLEVWLYDPSTKKVFVWTDMYNYSGGAAHSDETYCVVSTTNYSRVSHAQMTIPAQSFLKYYATGTPVTFYLNIYGYRRIA